MTTIIDDTNGNSAVDFLRRFHGDDAWHLVSIKNGDLKACSFFGENREARAAEWVARLNNDGYDVYHHINPIDRNNHKASKSDVVEARWLWTDLDPARGLGGSDLDAWRVDCIGNLANGEDGLPLGIPAPTLTVDSGRGFWLFWRLAEPQPVDGNGPVTARVESFGRGIREAFGAAGDFVQNIERIARLPGTVNHKTGGIARVLAYEAARAYSLDDFPRAGTVAALPEGTVEGVEQTELADEAVAAINEDDLNAAMMDLLRCGVPEGSRSVAFHQVVTGLRDANGLTAAQIEGVMRRHPLGVAEKYMAPRDRLRKMILASWQKVDNTPSDVRRDPDGSVVDHTNGVVLYAPPAAMEVATQELGAPSDSDVSSELPDHLTRPPGMIGVLTDWIVSVAKKPNRTLAFASALAVMSVIFGRKYASPTNCGTGLYILGIGPTGCGKDHAINMLISLLQNAQAGACIGSPEAMSQTAMVKQLLDQPLSVSAIDEIGLYLKRINSKKAGVHDQGIKKVLLEAWAKNFNPYMTPAWANTSSKMVHAPCLTILGLTTPESFYQSLDGADIDNGMLNRFLILRTGTIAALSVVDDGDDEEAADEFDVPENIKDALCYLFKKDEHPVLGDAARFKAAVTPIRKKLKWASGAKRRFHDFQDRKIRDMAMADAELAPFLARTAEMSLRIALIQSLSARPDDMRIDVDDLAFGEELALWSAQSSRKAAVDHMPQTDRERLANRLFEIARRKGRPVTHRDIQQSTRCAYDSRMIRDILDSLAEAGRLIKTLPSPASRMRLPTYAAV